MPVKLDQLLLNYDQSGIDVLLHQIVTNWEIRSRIFISPDEPLEEWRKWTFDRIKYRAERASKQVVVNGDILSIDEVMVFSLENGNLIQDGWLTTFNIVSYNCRGFNTSKEAYIRSLLLNSAVLFFAKTLVIQEPITVSW